MIIKKSVKFFLMKTALPGFLSNGRSGPYWRSALQVKGYASPHGISSSSAQQKPLCRNSRKKCNKVKGL